MKVLFSVLFLIQAINLPALFGLQQRQGLYRKVCLRAGPEVTSSHVAATSAKCPAQCIMGCEGASSCVRAEYDSNGGVCKHYGTLEANCSTEVFDSRVVYTLIKSTWCRNGGTEVNGTCNCPPSFTGQFCQSDVCSSNPCQNGGTCYHHSSGASCLCTPGYVGSSCETNRNFLGTLLVPNGLPWGVWGSTETCPLGTLAHGVRLKVQAYDGETLSPDDTTVNGFSFLCQDVVTSAPVAEITSSVGSAGEWAVHQATCPASMYIVAFRLRATWSQGASLDDTGVNNLYLKCRPLNGHIASEFEANGVNAVGDYGSWSAICPLNSGVCAITTSVDPGLSDDKTGLNDVRVECCHPN